MAAGGYCPPDSLGAGRPGSSSGSRQTLFGQAKPQDRRTGRLPDLLAAEIAASDRSTHKIAFRIADDIEGIAERIRQVRLRINVTDLVWADQLRILLNGQSLAEETCLRDYGSPIAPYNGQWLEFHLRKVRPRRGQNRLEFILDGRAEGLVSPLKVEDVEVIVEYGSYPSTLNDVSPS